MTLVEFTRNASREFLQTVVFVDDEIYEIRSDRPIEVVELPQLSRPIVGNASAASVAQRAQDDVPALYHPRELVDSFAKQGMVCALYQPREGFDTAVDSELFTLCERADVAILDWDLFGQDGRNILPLIEKLMHYREEEPPRYSRLLVVYTAKPNLGDVERDIQSLLGTAQSRSAATQERCRVVVFGKPGIVGRTDGDKLREVAERDLAERVVEEFGKLHSAMLASFALKGIAAIRRNSKRVLDKFRGDLDAVFLAHRAALLPGEDACELIPELLAEELLSVLVDEWCAPETYRGVAEDVARNVTLDHTHWKNPPANEDPGEAIRKYLAKGKAGLYGSEKAARNKDNVPFPALHAAFGCGSTFAEKRLATLFNLRSYYGGSKSPTLGLGTIVRRVVPGGGEPEYSLCLMPVCDSIRLQQGKRYAFPFWRLRTLSNGGSDNGCGFVVETPEGAFLELLALGKPSKQLWLEEFPAGASGVVSGERQGSALVFTGNTVAMEWVGQLKPTHAQRIAHRIGQSFSRVAVAEAEWLRLISENRK